jgi:hypothetical protein
MDIDVSKLDRSHPAFGPKSGPADMKLATPNFQFISDGTAAGADAVTAMVAVAEQDYATVKAIFNLGDIPGLPSVVTVDVNAGGAYHQTCADTGIHLIPEDAPSLLVAEHVECFQALSGKWNCGQTDGEGLSRALAITVRPFKVLTGLDGDVQGWWNNGSPRDFVNDNSQNDQNGPANACGTLFLFYLNSLGYTWNQIVAAGDNSLGLTYSALTGKSGSQGFTEFVAALKGISQPWSDNPFPASTGPSPVPTPVPNPTPSPTGSGCNPFGNIVGLFGSGGG